jgi:hypothetical protein
VRILGFKGDEIEEPWRKLYNVELYEFYSLPELLHCLYQGQMLVPMGERNNLYTVLVGRHHGRRPLGRGGE